MNRYVYIIKTTSVTFLFTPNRTKKKLNNRRGICTVTINITDDSYFNFTLFTIGTDNRIVDFF